MPDVTPAAPAAPTPAPVAATTAEAIDTGSDPASIQRTLDMAFSHLPRSAEFTAGTLGQVPQNQTPPAPGINPAQGLVVPPAMPWARTDNSVGTGVQQVIEPAPFVPELSPAAPAAPVITPLGETTPVTPVEPATAPETPAAPASDDIAPAGAEAQAKWNELKAAAKEASVLKQQLAEFEGTKAEYKTLQETYAAALKEREAIEVEVYKTRVVASKKFNELVVKPFDALEADTLSIAKEAEIDGEALFGAMVQGNKKAMLELTSSLHPYDQTKVFTMFDKMRGIVAERNNLIEDSRAQYEADIKSQEQERVSHQAKVMAERQSALDTVIPALTQKIMDILPEADRSDLNSIREELGNFDSWPEHYKVYGTAAATVLPKLVHAFQGVQAQLKEAQAEINKLRGGAPRLQTGVTAQPTAPVRQATSTPAPGTTFADLAKQGTNNILASMGLPPQRM